MISIGPSLVLTPLILKGALPTMNTEIRASNENEVTNDSTAKSSDQTRALAATSPGQILRKLPQSVFWKDRHGRFLGGNDKFLQDLGVGSMAEIIGKTDYELPYMNRIEADFFVQCDLQVMKSGTPLINIEEYQMRPDGTRACLLTSKVPIRDGDGKVVGILGTYTELTEFRKSDGEFERTEESTQEDIQAWSRFLNSLCMDVQNPLQEFLKALDSQLSSTAKPLPEELAKNLRSLNNTGKVLLNLLNEALFFKEK